MTLELPLHCRVAVRDFNHGWIDFFERTQLIPEIYLKHNDLAPRAESKIDEITAWVRAKKIRPTLHAPVVNVDPVAFDSVARNEWRDVADQVAAIAGKLGAVNIVCHPIFDKYANRKDYEKWMEENLLFFDHFLARTRGLGVTVTIENIFDERPEPLYDLIERLASERCLFCFDVGHFYSFSKASLSKWFDLLGDHLAEIHIHDNHGETDEHLPPGEGTFSFKKLKPYLSRIDRSFIITMEPLSREAAERALKGTEELLGIGGQKGFESQNDK